MAFDGAVHPLGRRIDVANRIASAGDDVYGGVAAVTLHGLVPSDDDEFRNRRLGRGDFDGAGYCGGCFGVGDVHGREGGEVEVEGVPLTDSL